MAYYAEQADIEAARRVDALTYLLQCEPSEVIRVSKELYTTKTHDSLKIRGDGSWYWWSRETGGHTALDYLVAVKGLTMPEAVHILTGQGRYFPPRDIASREKGRSPPIFELPPKNGDNRRVFAYLSGRGIDAEVINHCIKYNLLFEDKEHHNAVFVGYGQNGEAKYAAMRSTLSKSTFLRDVGGSDKRHCFALKPTEPTDTLYAFEGAIDALSFATLLKMNGCRWRDFTLLSLGGVYVQKQDEKTTPISLSQYLYDNPGTSRIFLCLDNDETGRGAAGMIRELLPNKAAKYRPPKQGKDYNEYLCMQKGIQNNIKTRGEKEYSAR
jgi:hypothetical protein